jgi:hypothetical protein
MEHFFARAWEQLIGRVDGPMFFRFILQPTVAIGLAVRAGLADARANRAPYLWTVATDRAARGRLVREGFADVGRVFVFAILLDFIYQMIVFGWLYPVQSLIVAVALAIVPYVVVRGPVNRLASRHR